MSSAGYYVTVSSSALSSGGNSISSANVSGNVAGATVSTLSGTTNSSVTVPGAIGSGYTPLNNATTLLQRSGGGGVSGTYGVNLGLRVLIPAYTPAGSYSGIVTFTLIEN